MIVAQCCALLLSLSEHLHFFVGNQRPTAQTPTLNKLSLQDTMQVCMSLEANLTHLHLLCMWIFHVYQWAEMYAQTDTKCSKFDHL